MIDSSRLAIAEQSDWGSASAGVTKKGRGHILPNATAILGAIDVMAGECDR